MENATTAGSSQCNISRIYIWKDLKRHTVNNNKDNEVTKSLMTKKTKKIKRKFGNDNTQWKQPNWQYIIN